MLTQHCHHEAKEIMKISCLARKYEPLQNKPSCYFLNRKLNFYLKVFVDFSHEKIHSCDNINYDELCWKNFKQKIKNKISLPVITSYNC